eukprot:836579-Rhodomonas_salina.6
MSEPRCVADSGVDLVTLPYQSPRVSTKVRYYLLRLYQRIRTNQSVPGIAYLRAQRQCYSAGTNLGSVVLQSSVQRTEKKPGSSIAYSVPWTYASTGLVIATP